LGGKPTLPQPFSPPNVPLQPHPSIMDILEPYLQPMDDGWINNLVHPPSGIAHWPASPRDAPLPHVSAPIVTSAASVAHSSPKDNKMPLPEIPGDKGKKPIEVRALIHLSPLLHNQKRNQVKIDYDRREISFNDMHPELIDYEGRKEREIYFKKMYPELFKLICYDNVYFWIFET
jgi:hypothetical protein